MTSRRKRAEDRGRRGEAWAALWLMAKGYRILARRYQTPLGEIDLIARKGGAVAIIEVKARPDLASGIEAIGARQRQRLVRAAKVFLARHPRHQRCVIRFDALIVRPFRLPHHLIDAWPAEEAIRASFRRPAGGL